MEEFRTDKNENISKHEIILTKKGKKTGLKIFLIVASVLMVIIIGIAVFVWNLYNKEKNRPQVYFIVAPELNITEKADGKGGKDTFLVVSQSVYGIPFALDKTVIKSNNKFYQKIVPFPDDYEYPVKHDLKKGDLYLELKNENDIAFDYDFQNYYKQIFTTKETQKFASHIKKAIYDYVYTYDGGGMLVFTQNSDRIKHVITYDDFDTDGIKDIAVILESNDAQSEATKLLVLCYNKDQDKSYIAYESYTEYGKPIIKSFKKNAMIYMDSETTVAAPNNGIIVDYPASPNEKKVYLYNPKIKKFEYFYQRPKSEIEAEHGEEYYEGEYDGEEPVIEATEEDLG